MIQDTLLLVLVKGGDPQHRW